MFGGSQLAVLLSPFMKFLLQLFLKRQRLLVWQEVFDLWPYRQETNPYPDLTSKTHPNPNPTATLGLIQLSTS